MKVGIKRFDPAIPLPEYKSQGAAAVDVAARTEVTIAPHTVELVPLNIALELPPRHFALLAARSSLHKKGLMMANGIGIGDSDYCGDGDEYRAALFNFTDQPVVVAQGERIVQLLILPVEQINWVEKPTFLGKNRGGFGSTG